MPTMNKQNYFDKLLEKGLARSIISEEQRESLSTEWHSKEKAQALTVFYLVISAMSVVGIIFGFLFAIPEALNSEAFQTVRTFVSNAAGYVYRNFSAIMAQYTIKAAFFFLAGLAANYVGAALEKKDPARFHSFARAIYVLGAMLHAVATGYVIMQGVVYRQWEELEVTSVSFWCLIPLVMTFLSGDRPLFYQLLTGVIIGAHSLAYFRGVSGNTFIAFDISTAIVLISIAQIYSVRNPRLALCIKYMSLTIICFLLYCTGFVWDLPAILEFRGYIKPNAYDPSRTFLVILFILSLVSVAAGYLFKPGTRTWGDRQFTLLLLATLLFAYFSTAIIMGFVSVGYVFDLFGGQFKQSIFTSNALLALFFSWTIWFLWCIWALVESKADRNTLLAQIGVTALLGSIEIRYVEICMNFSFTVGLVMLPIALVLAAIAARILSKWLKDLVPEKSAASISDI